MNTKQIDKVICKALATCNSHMDYQNRLDFHLAINRLTPVEAQPAVLKVLTDFRVKNANKPTTYEAAEAEISKDMQSELNFPRGVASIERAIKNAGGNISDSQLSVLRTLSPDSDYEGFKPQSLKEQWEQAVIQAGNADKVYSFTTLYHDFLKKRTALITY